MFSQPLQHVPSPLPKYPNTTSQRHALVRCNPSHVYCKQPCSFLRHHSQRRSTCFGICSINIRYLPPCCARHRIFPHTHTRKAAGAAAAAPKVVTCSADAAVDFCAVPVWLLPSLPSLRLLLLLPPPPSPRPLLTASAEEGGGSSSRSSHSSGKTETAPKLIACPADAARAAAVSSLPSNPVPLHLLPRAALTYALTYFAAAGTAAAAAAAAAALLLL